MLVSCLCHRYIAVPWWWVGHKTSCICTLPDSVLV